MYKRNLSLTVALAGLILLVSCSEDSKNVSNQKEINSREYSVQSLLWQQQSAEFRALCYQAYNLASDRIEEIQSLEKSEVKKPLAIVSDLDETAIDNSFYNANLLRENIESSSEAWKNWVLMEKATALPGALNFFNSVSEKGIEVFYISNRRDTEKQATINNLKKLGFPNADSSHVLLKTNTGGKQIRRNKVLESYDVILYMGDNLSDLSELYDEKGTEERNNITDSLSGQFGRQFIVFPNPMYGDWERYGIYEGKQDLSPNDKDSLRRAKIQSF